MFSYVLNLLDPVQGGRLRRAADCEAEGGREDRDQGQDRRGFNSRGKQTFHIPRSRTRPSRLQF